MAQALDPLLVRHAEPLLFVHDQQAQIVEPYVLREQPVRADDHVDPPRRQVLQDGGLLRAAAEPADHLDPDRKRGEAVAERLVVLEHQHRGRRQQRHLLAVHHGLERGPQRHLGLAVAHVPAQQPVHGRRRFHVALDVGDRRHLIGRQLVLEGRLELLLPVGVGGEAVAGYGAPCGIELQQLLGHVAHGLADAGLGPLPARAAQAIERRILAPGVLLDQVELVDRHEQLVPAGIADLHQLM